MALWGDEAGAPGSQPANVTGGTRTGHTQFMGTPGERADVRGSRSYGDQMGSGDNGLDYDVTSKPDRAAWTRWGGPWRLWRL